MSLVSAWRIAGGLERIVHEVAGKQLFWLSIFMLEVFLPEVGWQGCKETPILVIYLHAGCLGQRALCAQPTGNGIICGLKSCGNAVRHLVRARGFRRRGKSRYLHVVRRSYLRQALDGVHRLCLGLRTQSLFRASFLIG
jgi:hypothetical protein